MTQNATQSKNTAAANTGASKGHETPKFEMPKGFQNQSVDIVGYYDPEVTGMIHIRPREAILMDGNIEARKTAILIMAEILEPCKLKPADKDARDAKQTVEGKKGDIVGIWGKYGMKGLRMCAGVEVCMFPNGKKDVGKPKPMELYAIGAKGTGTLIPILEDKREESAGEPTWLDPKATEKAPF